MNTNEVHVILLKKLPIDIKLTNNENFIIRNTKYHIFFEIKFYSLIF
jgi:hypothetical protein